MRVLLVSSLWPPAALGGAETYAAALADALVDEGHDVAVVTGGGPDDRIIGHVPSWPYSLRDWSDQGRTAKALFHARDQLDPVTAAVLDGAIRSFRPDVVHSHAVVGMSVSALLGSRWRRVPHVHTLHDYWLLCQRSTMVDRTGTSCDGPCASCRAVSTVRLGLLRHRPGDVVLAVSHAVAEPHRRAGVRNIRVLYNPLPDEPSVPRPAPVGRGFPLSGPLGPPTFGYLGQLVDVKGVATLLAAVARRPPGSLLVAGNGPLAAAVEDADGVTFLGWLDAAGKEDLFRRIDCLVVPSEWRDPAPLVIGEAVAHGIPVIGADIGGIPELVPPSCRELLFRPGDAVDLAAKMRLFADDPTRFTVAGVEQEGWGRHVEAVIGAYEDAIRARGSGAVTRRGQG